VAVRSQVNIEQAVTEVRTVLVAPADCQRALADPNRAVDQQWCAGAGAEEGGAQPRELRGAPGEVPWTDRKLGGDRALRLPGPSNMLVVPLSRERRARRPVTRSVRAPLAGGLPPASGPLVPVTAARLRQGQSNP
jgi:hypothetical protein